MRHNASLPFWLVLCLIFSACTSSQIDTPSISPSPSAVPPVATSTPNPIRIVERSSLGMGMVTHSEFSPDGERLGVVTSLGVYIYDAETLELQLFIPGGSSFWTAAFSPDWSLVALGSGSTVTLRSLAKNETVTELETQQGQINRLLFSPDGSLLVNLVQPPGEEVYTNIAELWRISDGKLLASWDAGARPDVAFGPDGKTFYAWNLVRMQGIHRWQIPSARPLATLEDLQPSSLAFSPDGKLLAADAISTTEIVIQGTSDSSIERKLPIEKGQGVRFLRFSPDSTMLAGMMHDGTTQVWRVTDGTLLRSFETGSNVNLFLAISADNKTLALPTLDGVALHSIEDDSLLRSLHNHPNAVHQAAISPKGDKAAAVVEGDGLMVWDLVEGKVAYSLSKVGAIHLAWSPDGQWLALGGWNKSLDLLRAEDGKKIRSIPAHDEQVQSVAFSPDGSLMASSSMGSVKLWRFSDGSLLQSFSVSGGWVPSIRFSPDGEYLAATSAEGKLEVWLVNDGQHVAELLVPELSGDQDVFDFSPQSDYLAIAESTKILLWRFSDDKPFLSFSVGDAKITTLRVSPDGSLLVCGLTDGDIQFWQIPEGELMHTIKGGDEVVASLDFSADGQVLLSASRDGTMRIWEVMNGVVRFPSSQNIDETKSR